MIKKSTIVTISLGICTILLLSIFALYKYNLKPMEPVKDLRPVALETQESNTEENENQDNIRKDKQKYDGIYFDKYIKQEETKFLKEAKTDENNDKLFEKLLITYMNTISTMNQEVIDKIDLDDIQDEYYKTSWVQIWAEEGNAYYDLNRKYLSEKYKEYISTAYYEWLNHLDKTAKLINDAGLTKTPDELREYIIYLEKFVKKYPDFTDIDGVNFTLNKYLDIYLMGLDNTPVFTIWDNKMNPEFKSSYEKFLNENKDSKYYPMVEELYSKAKENNFNCDNKLREWHQQIFYNKYFKKD